MTRGITLNAYKYIYLREGNNAWTFRVVNYIMMKLSKKEEATYND